MHNDDQQILALYKNQKTREKAFELLIDKYSEKIYWHIRRMVYDHDDANDLLQEVLIKVWHGLEGFRGDAKLYTWLYRIASNETITFLNKKKKKMTVPVESEDYNLAETISADPWFNGDEAQLKLQQAINCLPNKQRLVFNMRYFNEMKYEDISQALGTSVGALKASFHHAVKKIELYLTGH